MKGVIFNVVEEVVTERFGADTWDDLLEHAGIDGAFTALGSYPDADLVALVAAAAAALDTAPEDVLRLVGRAGLSRLAGRYPQFVEKHTSSRSVLLALNSVIHPQVLALYPGASVPSFTVVEDVPSRIVLDYSSERGLCHLAEGLASGTLDHFGEEGEVEQSECRHRGDARCRIIVRYTNP